MQKIILFNEQEEYLEFADIHDAAKHLGVTADKIVFAGKVNKESKVKGYYVEFEEDKIVHYTFKNPLRIYLNLDDLCNTLLIHPEVVKKSLRSSDCMQKNHFKYFSQTHGRRL